MPGLGPGIPGAHMQSLVARIYATSRDVVEHTRQALTCPPADLSLFARTYLGRWVGSPPGAPGGGMTGVLPPPGAGASICGSRFGGQITPSVRASLSLVLSPLPVMAGGSGPRSP